MIIVCKGCQKRYPGCHAGCEWYKAERMVLDKENARRKDEIAARRLASNGWSYRRRVR